MAWHAVTSDLQERTTRPCWSAARQWNCVHWQSASPTCYQQHRCHIKSPNSHLLRLYQSSLGTVASIQTYTASVPLTIREILNWQHTRSSPRRQQQQQHSSSRVYQPSSAHLISGISSLCLFVNLILAPVPPSPAHLFLHPSPLCTSITPSLFHSRLKTYLFHKSYPCSFTSSSRTAFTDYWWTISCELLGFCF